MAVRAENKVEYEDIKKFVNASSATVRIMLIVFILFMVIIAALFIFSSNESKSLYYPCAGLLWCGFVYLYIFLINPKMMFSTFKKKYGSSPVKFSFNKQNLAITIGNEDGSFEIRKNYRDVFRVIENENYFFINVKRNEAYILKKRCITEGSADELRKLLIGEMGKNYKFSKK